MPKLVGLFDLKRKKVVHALNGGEETIEIMGLSAPEYFKILDRYPPVAALFLGGKADIFNAVKAVPGALTAWVAAACGFPNNPEAEQAAASELTLEEATALVESSMALTFSNGFDIYLARQGRILGNLVLVPTEKAPDAVVASTEEPMPESAPPQIEAPPEIPPETSSAADQVTNG